LRQLPLTHRLNLLATGSHYLAEMSRIMTFIVAVIALVASANADEVPAACTGNNLFAELQKSHPEQAAQILKEMAAVPNQGPLLWKITSRKSKKPSWLMGTMHVTDTRIATLSDDVQAKVKAARVLVLELQEIQNKRALTAKLLSYTKAVNMPEGKTLWDVIPDDQKKIVRYNPIIAMAPPDRIAKLQPWVVAQSLNAPFCEQLRQPFKLSLDETLAQRAQVSGVPIEGLETVEEQVKVMSSLTMDEQVQGLVALAGRKIPAEDIYITMADMYVNRQVSAFMPLSKYLFGSNGDINTQASEKFMVSLIDKRNIIMAKRAAKYLDKGNAFVAVGALHLPGQKGVIELLRKSGYKVTPAE
jgi:uncharacterized protein